ncbi:MAG: RNA 2',3'-cyclic phosphodiesterase [Thermoguttaceae bacterium]|jgi:2'-5' RNA ligase
MRSVMRAFVAIDIFSGIRQMTRKALRPLQRAFPDVKWVDDANFHITLKFLGTNVPTSDIRDIVNALERACKDVEPFDLTLEGCGAFPDMSNPRTLWIGITDGTAEVSALAEKIEDELEKIGYPREGRKFSPHLTIGRARKRDRNVGSINHEEVATLAEKLGKLDQVYFGTNSVESITLYCSELDRRGPKYEPLATIDFGGEDVLDVLKTPAKPELEPLPPPKKVKLDLDALDSDLDDELRSICGDAFVNKSKPKK